MDNFNDKVGKCLFYTPSSNIQYSWRKFANGYRLSTLCLINEIEKDNYYSAILKNDLIFPLLYLTRHTLELYLKLIIVEYSIFTKTKIDIPIEHRLKILWPKVKTIIAYGMAESNGGFLLNVKPPFKTVELDSIEDTINNICNYDINSESFRYPYDKNIQLLLDSDFKVPIETFKRIIIETCITLDDISNAINISEFQRKTNQ